MRTRREQARVEHDDAFYADALANPANTKRCYACEQTKRVSRYRKERGRYDGFKSMCKDCCRLADRQRNRVRRRGSGWHRRRLLRVYGLTVEDYKRMLHTQNGVCAICHQPPSEGKNLVVDHSHQGQHVRGLLCGRCNTALGLLGEDAATAMKAADYLLAF